jgi:hypothetical protein
MNELHGQVASALESERRENARRPEHWQRRELTLSRKKSRGRRRR